MVNKLESHCDSCAHSEIRTVDSFTVSKFRKIVPCKRLNYFCWATMQNKPKFVKIKECNNYRPKAGQIDKHIYQKQLGE